MPLTHKTLTSDLAPGTRLPGAVWDEEHEVTTLDMIGLADDPVSPENGQIWYNETLGLHRIQSGGRTITLRPACDEVTVVADRTITEADDGRFFVVNATVNLTLPVDPPVGMTFTVAMDATNRATFITAATVGRDNFVWPTEIAEFTWGGTTWRRRHDRGFGVNNLTMGLLTDLRATGYPSGLWRVDATTSNIAARPSHMPMDCNLRHECWSATSSVVTIWSLNADDGVWRAVCNSGTWSAWASAGAMAALTTAQRPTNVRRGSMIYDTTLGALVVFNGSAWVAV